MAERPVTICVTGLRGIPGVMGGIESHCEELLPRIKASAPGLSLTVLGRAPYLSASRQEHRGIEVVGLPCPRSKHFETILSTLAAILEARRRGAAIVHIHAIGPALLAPLARLLGMRVVVTHHGTDYERAKWGPAAKAALRIGERMALNFATRVIAISPSLADKLQRDFPARAAHIHYIPNGAPILPDEGRADETLDRLGLGASPFLLAVGRLVPEKGLHDLIAAHAASATPRKLVIVGGADHQDDYARALLSEAGERVIFAGVQPRAVLRHLFERADLFVMPSYHEGLPIAALEAGSCGAPMLLSDIPANRDLALGENHYFPVGDIAVLSRAIERPSSAYAVDAAEIRSRFCWDRAAAETLAVYHELMPAREPLVRIPARS